MAWTGYYVTGTPQTSVSATWVVPAINVASSPVPSNVLIWVGLDGDGNNFVEQCGVGGLIDPGGTVRWQAWGEFYPAGQSWWSQTAYPVSTGDSITATVQATTGTGGSCTLSVADTTQGWSASMTRTNATLTLMNTAPPPLYTAEVIIETDQPENLMADYGTVTFTGVTGLGAAPNSIVNSPSAISSPLAAGSFALTWQ